MIETLNGASPRSVKLSVGEASTAERSRVGREIASVSPCEDEMIDYRRERFDRLVRRWREETKWLSSTTEIAMHPAYQAIIGMGPEALPMIIDDLRDNSGYWYWALQAISNEEPVPPCDRGVINRMKAAWLRWAEEKGIVRQ